MNTLPCQGCRGLCCGPVPVTEQEYKRIKKSVKAMPDKKRQQLKEQERFPGTCIFFDLERDRCGIYAARPEVCKMFGLYQGMACFRKPEAAVKPMEHRRPEKPAGILSIDFTWKHFE
ncbi:YkgJ family cysteine cluster protein [Paenibacillus thermotolerans]|uniref:YkgJ family cysteine cluster protein n=1 Tax=Paenibacillus thermotolerans TaxID=3027807 RepID=UPI002367D351|nr:MULTISPECIES: YkgJ family cysteine cluster protein [unclassified Paenibacillus]